MIKTRSITTTAATTTAGTTTAACVCREKIYKIIFTEHREMREEEHISQMFPSFFVVLGETFNLWS